MPYAAPRHIAASECAFYHSMDIPNHGRVAGMCDMRAALPHGVDGLDLDGKRVLEVGPASGFFTFAMERAGAEVVACELAPTDSWDVVPGGDAGTFNRDLDRVRNGFWFAHEHFASKAQVFECPVYRLPQSLGRFDVACIHHVLTHLRDPMGALEVVSSLTDKTLVISEIEIAGASLRRAPFRLIARHFPLCYFRPERGDPINSHTWWQFSPRVFEEMIYRLGFRRHSLDFYSIKIGKRTVSSYTIAAHR